jgi:hypothetical protein
MTENTKQQINTGTTDSEEQKNQDAIIIENQNGEEPKVNPKPRTRVSKTVVPPTVKVEEISEDDNSLTEEITLTTEIMSKSEKDKDKIKKVKYKLKLKKQKEKEKEKAKKEKKKKKDKKAKEKKVKKAKAKKLEKVKAKKKKKAKNKKK